MSKNEYENVKQLLLKIVAGANSIRGNSNRYGVGMAPKYMYASAPKASCTPSN